MYPSEWISLNPKGGGVAHNGIQGGFGQIGPNAFTFTVDPNAGRCTQGVQPGS